jgi:hypothetical protein
MFCRLTQIGALISLVAATSAAQSPVTKNVPATPARTINHSVEWQELPLKAAIKRLESGTGAEIFVDRRVDPNRRLDLTVAYASVDQIIAELAAKCSLGWARVDRLFYVGPQQTADRLTALAAIRRRDVNELSPEARLSLMDRRRIVWPRLTEPRGLIVRLLEEHGWQVLDSERIPHDLWAAGELPPMTLADQLTVLLAGFELTYQTSPSGRAIEIVPIDWSSVKPLAAAAPKNRRTPHPAGGEKQVFTLRIENEPVGRVLEQLSQRLGWKLSVDETGLRTAGRSLDRRVSFAVEDADEDRLLDALLAPAGLKAARDGNSVRISPR